MSNVEDVSAFKRLTGDVYLYGNVGLALAMGQETGVVHAMSQAMEPLSSTAIAHRTQLKERFVRELLNALTTAGLVQVQKGTGGPEGLEAMYWVPPVHRETLAKAATSCLALSSAARRFAAVKECFQLNGPSCVRYDQNHFDFLEKMSALKVNKVTEALLQTPGLQTRLETGIAAAEVGCGSGRLFTHLAAMFPRTRFTLTDVVPDTLQIARQRGEEDGLTNTNYHVLDVSRIPADMEERFDWMVADAVIHDLPHPLKALQGILKMLKPGGCFSLVDLFVSSYVAGNVTNKSTAALYTQGFFSCIPESYQQPDSEALGPCWGKEKALDLLNAAGFKFLGMARSVTEEMGPMAVCMCQKPE